MLGSPLHEHHLLRYSVASNLNGSKYVTVSFYDDYQKRVLDIEYTQVSMESLIKNIESGTALHLEHVYIHDFSMASYRKLKHLNDDAPVELNDFTAKGCFFDCSSGIDFSNVRFTGAKTHFENCIFANGTADFSNTVFKSQDVSFRKSKFGSGSTVFRSAQFTEGRVNFNHVNFGTGTTVFVDVNFSTCFVDFRNTYFGDGTVDFKFSKFKEGPVTFERAHFGKGRKDFKNVEFGLGKLDFKKVQFNDGDVIFEGVECSNDKILFRGSVFGNGVKNFEQCHCTKAVINMEQVDFGTGILSFHEAHLGELHLDAVQLNLFTDLRWASCTSLHLNEVILRDILELPLLHQTTLNGLDLNGLRILGRLFVTWSDALKGLIYKQPYDFNRKAEQFRVLKENFRINGQYEDEDAAYVEYRRCMEQHKLEIYNTGVISKLYNRIKYAIKWILFDQIGRYATDPVRVIFHALGTVVLFACVYWVMAITHTSWGSVGTTLPETMNRAAEFGNCLYYSAITFFTVGYGDYFALGWIKLFAVIEGFCGVFLMSYFTVAFVRKILR